MLIFLASSYWFNEALLNIFPRIFSLLALLSLVLAVFLGYRLANHSITLIDRLTPIVVNYLGFSPFLVLCLLLSPQWNPPDYSSLVLYRFYWDFFQFWFLYC